MAKVLILKTRQKKFTAQKEKGANRWSYGTYGDNKLPRKGGSRKGPVKVNGPVGTNLGDHPVKNDEGRRQ